jgi:acyl dehydratase
MPDLFLARPRCVIVLSRGGVLVSITLEVMSETTKASAHGVEGAKSLIGKTLGPSEWRTVTQEDITDYARLTGDHQWIHVDVERAKKESPFGTTVAHGNLTLSMIDGMREELVDFSGFQLGVNYGWNKVRFPAPVPAGARVRASGEILEVEAAGGPWYQVVQRITVEVEGSEKPACVADSVGRVIPTEQ